ncbi:hypothetical protein A7K93_06245 [Candidatus Methylacidiphilum fumarolicum]|uniref:Uncharacterized protein n=2 Tax=Candidatus Methylacidiphilum fumarolicum TaxID=591154 RepID=I0K0M4_METFB|nr:hypothetical protein [Candidatus Methylacidiphilum fumarolicum]MBW6415512.1 hypothetical protein [Candidatus Methylacidiphilum fumarolicum]TFE68115.1 hypothetical protein A7K73_07910 [Candidatus Methylacidiphilum fumarolicum]TFE73467.1 hypothetical protein A7K93_06245 [Candidatus Methylacidiphilum fumarolicum]TFE74366.1 hypothetical protein A7K72_04255 [Candidatus Methylacidiphilum fumarolicum]TFE76920.1 hypothetical protein A7D33_07450 [Candidatus Methylacidiphilum fumarolicum]
MKRKLFVFLMLLFVSIARGQQIDPLDSRNALNTSFQNGNINSNSSPQIAEEDAPPVIINGKKAEELSEDELLQFLQQKVRMIHQEDGQVEILRISPGYPLAIEFSEPIVGWEIGDGKLIHISKQGAKLILRSLDTTGDTSLLVFFQGNRTRIYHIFVESDFQKALSLIRVSPFSKNSSLMPTQLVAYSIGTDEDISSVKSVAQIIANYDLLVREGSLKPMDVSRIAIFKRSKLTGFDYYYLYRFSSGLLAISFAWKNLYPYRVRLDESTLRVAIGQSRFIPDYVSLNKLIVPPGGMTSGFLIISNPPYSPDQPFSLIWKESKK